MGGKGLRSKLRAKPVKLSTLGEQGSPDGGTTANDHEEDRADSERVRRVPPAVPRGTFKGTRFEGKKGIMVVDTSIFLRKILSSVDAARQLFTLDKAGPVEVTDVVKYLANLCRVIWQQGWAPLLVLDGCRHPLKAKTTAHRKETRMAALDSLQSLVQAGRAQDRTRIDKLRTRSTYVREDVLASLVRWANKSPVVVGCLCAAFEADWCAANLVKQGIAQVALTEDSDFPTLARYPVDAVQTAATIQRCAGDANRPAGGTLRIGERVWL